MTDDNVVSVRLHCIMSLMRKNAETDSMHITSKVLGRKGTIRTDETERHMKKAVRNGQRK